MTELEQIVAAWPFAASLAVVFTAGGLRAGRRRSALNEALHELRRPLQAIALASGPGARGGHRGIDGSVRLAAAALERLDREINGGSPEPARGTVAVRSLLESAVARWEPRAAAAGGSLEQRWRAGHALVGGDPVALAQALDNLIVNAIEHGGASILVEARLRGGRLRVCVADSGRPCGDGEGIESSRDGERAGAIARLTGRAIARFMGRRRHGHGLAVVRRTAADHGGRFALRRSERGSLAVLDLPLAADCAAEGTEPVDQIADRTAVWTGPIESTGDRAEPAA